MRWRKLGFLIDSISLLLISLDASFVLTVLTLKGFADDSSASCFGDSAKFCPMIVHFK
jgi:hypothetical protein